VDRLRDEAPAASAEVALSAGRTHGLRWGLCAAFLLSGAAALVFETLWFRLAGLALGNSVWASTAVLSSFMAGLALGNALAARFGERIARPLRLYAAFEGAVAAAGLLLVLGFPWVGASLLPLLAQWRDTPWLLGGTRLVVAFGLMLLPATAMGATLPLLTRALVRHDARFGVALGTLYGWNTLGGVMGAALGESFLILHLGLRGSAFVAAGLAVAAGTIALALDTRWAPRPVSSASAPVAPAGARTARPGGLLAAAFLGGGILLGLEVVWFRFLQLFVFGTQTAFALMLATILAGIGLGGLLAAAWLRRDPAAHRHVGLVAVGGGIATIVTYAGLDPARVTAGRLADAYFTLALSVWLMLPTSVVSGVLFTLLGQALRRHVRGDSEAAGWLTLANTVGAAGGAALGGLVLLPALGVDASLFALAVSYGLVAWVVRPWREESRTARRVLAGGAAALLLLATLFPLGLTRARVVRFALAGKSADGARPVAFREGLTETAVLLQKDWGGQPVYHRLVTNAHSMTSTTFYGRRYMKVFAYLPLALRPEARRALLISYGLGNTGEALTRHRGLDAIDVVDVSPTAIELSRIIPRPGTGDPIDDPRVRLHIQDGRFFLLAGTELYDVITAEPPPPRGAGIVNLYSLEYFRLVRSRLVPGGVATHWLPVNQLSVRDSKGIVQAFCSVFEDCTLWSGAGYDWMLAGTNGLASPPSESAFGRLWEDEATGPDLRDLGIETPEQLGALFVADAATLGLWCDGAPPLIDDRPGRLSQRAPPTEDIAAYRELMDARASGRRFLSSPFVRLLWPPGLRDRTSACFRWQHVFNADFDAWSRPTALADLWAVLESSSLRTLPLLLLDSEPRLRDIARERWAAGDRHPALSRYLGVAALADRDYRTAARRFAEAEVGGATDHPARLLRALALGLEGRADEGLDLLGATAPESLPSHAEPWRAWLSQKLRRLAAPSGNARSSRTSEAADHPPALAPLRPGT